MKMRNLKFTACVSVGLLLATVSSIALLYPAVPAKETQLNAPRRTNTLSGTRLATDQRIVDESFSTHLPLVVLDTGTEEPRADSKWDNDKGYQVPVDYDPYANGHILLFDNEEGGNSLSDTPTITSAMRMRLRGNSSSDFEKKQYLVKLYDDNGNKNRLNMLGMGEDWEWVLNISLLDKSLQRNHLAYEMGRQTSVPSPDTRYCEVVRRNGSSYEYLGVYLLMENAERSGDRVDIPSYQANQTLSYILRRDRYDGLGVMLPTYGIENELLYGALELKYPSSEKLSKDDYNRILDEINGFEQALFSEDMDEYLGSMSKIEKDTFVDYFIVNELLMNYDGGFRSTYSHKGYNGKLRMGPFWDFDQALDNDPLGGADFDKTAMQEAPWFRQLLRDPQFVSAIITRYRQLRGGVFSDSSVMRFLGEVSGYLGPAIQRDWSRWGGNYTDDYLKQASDDTTDRNVSSYEEEITRLSTAYLAHAQWLDQNIHELYQYCDSKIQPPDKELLAQEQADLYSNLMAVVYIAVFPISVVLIQRET